VSDIDEAGASESIEPLLHVTIKLANLLASHAVSPAGMEPLGSVRHRRSPKGERMGNARVNRTKMWNKH
jgi:hypothetical protein